jgi:hypothetical protein
VVRADENRFAGRAEWIATPLDSRGRAPRAQMKINEAIGKAQPVNRVFDLRWKAAPDKGVRFGHPYSIQRDRSNRDYVSVYEWGK